MMAVAKKININNILPNPHRNFEIDPIDPVHVDTLVRSYKSSGDFGTLTARPVDDHVSPQQYELACGHHRLEAMRQLGYKEVDVKVMDMTAAKMVQVMVKENASQRGSNPAAVQDSIAATLEFIAEELLKYGTYKEFSELSDVGSQMPTCKSWEINRGLLKAGKGLGHNILRDFTDNVISRALAQEAIGTLKAGGEILKLITRVTTKLAGEAEEVLKARQEADRIAEEEAEAERKRLAKEAKKAEAARIKAEADAVAKAKADEAAAIKRAKDTKEAAEATAKRKAAEARAKAKREAEDAEAARLKKLQDDKDAAEKKKADRLEIIQIKKEAAEETAREMVQQAAEEKLLEKIDLDAIRLFTVSKHQSKFRTMLLENLDMFPIGKHVAIAKSIIMRNAALWDRKQKRKKDPKWSKNMIPADYLTTSSIIMAFGQMINTGRIWTKQMQAEEQARFDKVQAKVETVDIDAGMTRREAELRTASRRMETAVVDYVKYVQNHDAEAKVFYLTYKQDVRNLINALVNFDSTFGGKLDYLCTEIQSVKN